MNIYSPLDILFALIVNIENSKSSHLRNLNMNMFAILLDKWLKYLSKKEIKFWPID